MPSGLLIDFAAGSIGGAAGVFAGHPLDTVKVRLQMQSASATTNGTFQCLARIVKSDGIKGLYRGLSSPLSSVAFLNAIIFGVHGRVVKQFENRESLTAHFVAGFAAGYAQAFLASPSELLKLHAQLQSTGSTAHRHTPYSYLRKVVSEGRIRELRRGMLATQLRDSTGVGIYFAAYEFLARRMSSDGQMESLTSVQLLMAGGTAGIISWLFNYPVDVIKTRFQADSSHKSYTHVIQRAYAEGGVGSFFLGLNSTLMRAFPTNAATFFAVEWTYRILIDWDMFGALASKRANYVDSGHSHYITLYDLWSLDETNCHSTERGWPTLPEAGSTLIDPMLYNWKLL